MSVNEQLSKLCNIEPLIEDSCKISDRYWKNSHKIKGIHDDYVQRYCPYNMECTSECEYFYEKQIYPDFTKPENFVRLLELITRQTKEQNLETMFNHLKVNIHLYTEQTKQSIREAEWVYD